MLKVGLFIFVQGLRYQDLQLKVQLYNLFAHIFHAGCEVSSDRAPGRAMMMIFQKMYSLHVVRGETRCSRDYCI